MSRVEMFIDDMHKYTSTDIISFLERISSLKILVICEAVVDEYIYGDVIGKTNKSPSLVFKPKYNEEFAGVPMNIANNLSDFCGNVDLMMMSGNDDKIRLLTNKIKARNIYLYEWHAPSIVKSRYVSLYDNSKVFEVYNFQDTQFDHNKLLSNLDEKLNDYDLVIVGDSGHGMLTHRVRSIIKDKAKFLAVNAQMNAGNIGTHSVKKYMDRLHDIYICVNQREFRLAVHEYWDTYNNIDDLIRSRIYDTIAITMGSEGCKISRKVDGIVAVPSLINEIVDPVGAGDAFLSITSPLALMRAPIDIIGFVGNLAGGLHSMHRGNEEYIRKDDLYKHIDELLQ